MNVFHFVKTLPNLEFFFLQSLLHILLISHSCMCVAPNRLTSHSSDRKNNNTDYNCDILTPEQLRTHSETLQRFNLSDKYKIDAHLSSTTLLLVE